MFFSFKEKTFEQRWTPLRRGDFVSGDGLKNEGGNLKVCVECKVCFWGNGQQGSTPFSNKVNPPFYKTYEYIIPVQLICAYVPQLKGIDPSTPKDKDFHRKLGSKKLAWW